MRDRGKENAQETNTDGEIHWFAHSGISLKNKTASYNLNADFQRCN